MEDKKSRESPASGGLLSESSIVIGSRIQTLEESSLLGRVSLNSDSESKRARPRNGSWMWARQSQSDARVPALGAQGAPLSREARGMAKPPSHAGQVHKLGADHDSRAEGVNESRMVKSEE
ncbi:hypothetical protein LTR50_002083 [Elasticomyces elasticus]|nr:hypothetical protein LTR50_002083 [Elasticomyces elasticus]